MCAKWAVHVSIWQSRQEGTKQRFPVQQVHMLSITECCKSWECFSTQACDLWVLWYSLQPWTGQPNHRVSRVQCVCFSLLCPGSSHKWMGCVNIFWIFTSLHRKLIYPSDLGIQILVFRCLKFRKYSSEPSSLLWAYQIVAHKLNF